MWMDIQNIKISMYASTQNSLPLLRPCTLGAPFHTLCSRESLFMPAQAFTSCLLWLGEFDNEVYLLTAAIVR